MRKADAECLQARPECRLSKQLPVAIRWMIRRDMREVEAIERQSFEFPWSEEDFIRCLRQRTVIAMVAEADEKVVGFMVYELCRSRIHVLNLAVAPTCRRMNVGRQLIDKLKAKLEYGKRSRLLLEVRETNLAAQLFFRSLGFRAVSTIRDFYRDTPEDAYLFQYRKAST